MPLHYLGEIPGSEIELKDCFGFVEAYITAPKDIVNPLLLHNFEGKNIHPVGSWKGTYFSEELKAVVPYGYKVEILTVYQFTRSEDLFKDYIDHFYELKKTATSNKDETRKAISKLHLNSLYGMFGRKLDVLKTVASDSKNEFDILDKYPVKSIINVNKDINIFLIHDNVDFKLIKEANAELNIELIIQPQQFIKSNVAIASAITAYARIEMIKYKTIPGVKLYYTDTDSIFVNKELPKELVGSEIGQMIDELNGGWIKEAYFFGIKKYAYIDHNGNLKTIFSGLTRNSLTWEEIVRLANYQTLLKEIPSQFFKSLTKLQIAIKHKFVEIRFQPDKKLIDNMYQHIVVNDLNNNVFSKMVRSFIGKISKFLGRYKGNRD